MKTQEVQFMLQIAICDDEPQELACAETLLIQYAGITTLDLTCKYKSAIM